ncbi:hypothetical protein E4U55_000049 [Claviceps digitariae]|nr:hypothetical protein E4U55_000049 [Claviceps digitariae]
MDADKSTQDDRASIGPRYCMSEAAEGHASSPSATDKGKGKEVASVVDRIQSSGRAVLGSALSDLSAVGAQSGQKGSGNVGTSSSYQAHQSIYYRSQGQSKSELSSSSSQTFKPAKDAERVDTQYNAFAEGSGTGELAHLGHVVAQPPKSANSLQQSTMDGIDVVTLLSQPETCELPAQSEHYDLTPSQVLRLREGLFGSETGRPFWDQLLDFNAEFLVRPERFRTECEAHMGTSNLEEARSLWLHQWNDVLTSYTNEVWGDLGPLAKAAQSEITNIDQDEGNSDRSIQALERLRLVLAHVRGH